MLWSFRSSRWALLRKVKPWVCLCPLVQSSLSVKSDARFHACNWRSSYRVLIGKELHEQLVEHLSDPWVVTVVIHLGGSCRQEENTKKSCIWIYSRVKKENRTGICYVALFRKVPFCAARSDWSPILLPSVLIAVQPTVESIWLFSSLHYLEYFHFGKPSTIAEARYSGMHLQFLHSGGEEAGSGPRLLRPPELYESLS